MQKTSRTMLLLRMKGWHNTRTLRIILWRTSWRPFDLPSEEQSIILEDYTMPESLPIRIIRNKTSWGPCTTWSLDHHTTQEPSAPYKNVTRSLEPNKARTLQDHTQLWQEPLSTMGHKRSSGPYNSRSLQDYMILDPLRTMWHKTSWGTNDTSTLQDHMMQDITYGPHNTRTLMNHTMHELLRTIQL
jgi:hypothetical protein